MTKIRTIGDSPKNVSRRDFVKGGITAAIAIIAASSFGIFVTTTFAKAKEYIQKRTEGLYSLDTDRAVRKSHENSEIIALYKGYLSPGAVLPAHTELSHRLLHTAYGDKVPAQIGKLKSSSVDEAEARTAEEMVAVLVSAKKA